MTDLVDIPLSKIIKTKDLESLKSYGSYKDVKNYINNSIGLPFNGRNWSSLFNQIQDLSSSVNTNYSKLILIITKKGYLRDLGGFNEVKIKISKWLGVKVAARSWSSLEEKMEKILSVFFVETNGINAYDIYEKNKLKNFEASSELEGINTGKQSRYKKMEDVINKYRVNV